MSYFIREPRTEDTPEFVIVVEEGAKPDNWKKAKEGKHLTQLHNPEYYKCRWIIAKLLQLPVISPWPAVRKLANQLKAV